MKILEFRLFQGSACVPGDDRQRSSWRLMDGFQMSLAGDRIFVRRGDVDSDAIFSLSSGFIEATEFVENKVSPRPTFEELAAKVGPLPQTALATAGKHDKGKPRK